MIVPPVLCCRSHRPAAATCRVGRLPLVRLSVTRLLAAAAVATTTVLDARTCCRDRSTTTAPNAAVIDSGAPRSRSNRAGNPSSEVRLPAYIRTHHASTVPAASTCGGARKYLTRAAASAARPKSPSHTSAGPGPTCPTSVSRWSAGGTAWVPRALATAVEVFDDPG